MNTTSADRRLPGSATAALWACAALLGLNLLLGGGIPEGVDAAMAQSGASMTEPPFNAAEQRKRMIEQLTQMNDRLGRLEARLDKGINVKVLEMPAMKKDAE